MGTAAMIKPCDTPILQTEKPADAKKYAKHALLYQQELHFHFQYMRKFEATVNLILVPSEVHVDTLPAEFQIELTDLQCDTDQMNEFRQVRRLDICKPR
jgi:hypothetical protein